MTSTGKFKIFNCDHCNLTLTTKSSLRRHIKTQHSETVVRYRCNLCIHGKEYTGKDILHRHTEKTHGIKTTNSTLITRNKSTYKPKIIQVEKWTPPMEARIKRKPSPTPSQKPTATSSQTSATSTICQDEREGETSPPASYWTV